MQNILSVSILCGLSFLSTSSAVSYNYRNRETSFDDLKTIDGLVSSGLPLFSNGFFIETASGPVLVKSKDEGSLKKPLLNPGYYSTLPRVIPAGLEGIAISHFNLGTSIPAQGAVYHSQDREVQPQYSPDSNAPIYQQQPLPQQQQQQQQQQYFREIQPQEQLQQQQPQQQYLRQIQPQEQEQPTQQRQQRFLTQQSQQRFFTQESPSPQRFSPQERQQRFLSQQSQLRQRFAPPQQPQPQAPVAQETFQLNNFLTSGHSGDTPTSYQNQKQEFGPRPFASRTLTRNPTVEQALALEDELPEALRNPFYKNEELASALAQESLPVEGENVVGEWDTTKIQKIKIMELLRGAGFIS